MKNSVDLFKGNKGFTLLEIIIVIGLIGIAIGGSGFGLSVIFNGNVNAGASELVNEIRMAQTKQMASATKTYDVVITHDGDNYYVTTKMLVNATGIVTELKSIKMSNTMSIKKYNDSTSLYEELSSITDPVADTSLKVKTFRFSPSSGKILSSAHGKYRVSSGISSVVIDFAVVQVNGRVYIEQ